MMTGLFTWGKGVVGLIVWTPPPGIPNPINPGPGFAFAESIAALNEPIPVSAAVVTRKAAVVLSTPAGSNRCAGATRGVCP